jgi:branched-chain amino acid transport system substrate-binding protein
VPGPSHDQGGADRGPAAATGAAFEKDQAAVDYVNSKGGVMGKKLEVVFEDTAGVFDKPHPGSPAGDADKVDGAGCSSSSAPAKSKRANRMKILHRSGSSDEIT